MIERGVVLCAFGKRGYIWSAYNLAFSIKFFNPNMHITLLHDDTFERELLDWQKPIFDNTILIPSDVMYRFGKIDPANIKISIYDFMPYEYNLFIDVDAKALHDVNVIFDELIKDGKNYYCHVIGEHRLQDGNEIPQMYWAWANDIWSHYSLPNDAVLPCTNSSFQFVKKCDESKKLFDQIRENFENPIPLGKLRHLWGNAQPDELYLNVALAQLNMMPKTPRPYIWLANESLTNTLTWISDNYPLLCLFGSRLMIKTMYSEWYDRMLVDEMRQQGKPHFYKWHKIVGDKHANTKPSALHQSVYRDDIMVPKNVPGKINLIVPFYHDSNAERNKELVQCLKKNIACNNINKIFLLMDDEGYSKSIISDFYTESKLQIPIVLTSRQTFADAVRVANENADDDTISIIANTDIYFDDHNLKLIKSINMKKNALALSRWDIKPDGSAVHFNYEWSQDVYTWAGKLNTSEMDLNFPFGKPYCDSRFCYELNKERNVINPSYSIKTFHLHNITTRNYTESDRLSGEGIPVRVESAHRFMKKRMLFIQPGKVGDIILCMPIVRIFSREYIVDWKCGKEYHSLFRSFDYANPVENIVGAYDRTVDIAFGLGGAPEKFWQDNKHKYDSFVTLKYELAGISITEKTNLKWNRDKQRENDLFKKVVGDRKNYVLVHSSSHYGSPINVDKQNVVEFLPVDDFTIFDWYLVIINASEIHCIDSSLCNFIDAIKEAKDIPKFYHKTDKVPNKYDETILTNNWTRA